ncbi:MAG: RNase adapter RapZ [Actinomycetota bacterium]|nr:RNase adapter RapZ [Actinomycetota bacterium]MDP4641795.1 RNase adapter RapZ [Ilumatobacteraceae bacterium]MDP4834577.1 RNase adapter RapZ [Ilumatobacteraceae bacterium]
MAEILLITGLSGAGRSQAADALEDLGWFVVDNMPVELVDKFVELAGVSVDQPSRLALVIGVASQQTDAVKSVPRLRGAGHDVRVLFLEASTQSLVKRYTESRRKHPLRTETGTVSEAIEHERDLLEPVREVADKVIDTTALQLGQFKTQLTELFSFDDLPDTLQVSVVSFGFKHGIPLDVDTMFDVRFIPNPYYDEALRPLTGRDEAVRRFVLDQAATQDFLNRVEGLFESLIPAYRNEGKSYLTIAVGCTGGQHRSVAIAEALSLRLANRGVEARVAHRDIEKN